MAAAWRICNSNFRAQTAGLMHATLSIRRPIRKKTHLTCLESVIETGCFSTKSAERQGVISTIGDWQGCVFFGTKLLYQGGWGGWPTGNGKKVTKSQACGLAQLCLAAAEFLSISCGANYLRALCRTEIQKIWIIKALRVGWKHDFKQAAMPLIPIQFAYHRLTNTKFGFLSSIFISRYKCNSSLSYIRCSDRLG